MSDLAPLAYICAAVALAITVLAMPFAIKTLRRLKYGQTIYEDGGPAWHAGKKGTPTMGGVVFIIAITIAILLMIPKMQQWGDYSPVVMLGLSLIFACIGVVDDWTKIRKKRNKGLTAKQKLLLQVAGAVLFLSVMRALNYLDSVVHIPFTDISFTLPWPVYLVVFGIIIVGADNAVNITDGIDGLCASVTLVISLFFSAVFLVELNNAAIFALALSGGLLGFLLFNKFPAKIFMGDTGSLFLGGAVCAMAFASGLPLILALVGVVYIIETLSDIIQIFYFKATGGKRFFKMAPIHHHFEMCGWSEWKLVGAGSALTAAMCALSYFAF